MVWLPIVKLDVVKLALETDSSRLVFQGKMRDALNRTGHLPAAPITITLFCENMFGLVTNNPIPPVQASIVIIPSGDVWRP